MGVEETEIVRSLFPEQAHSTVHNLPHIVDFLVYARTVIFAAKTTRDAVTLSRRIGTLMSNTFGRASIYVVRDRDVPLNKRSEQRARNIKNMRREIRNGVDAKAPLNTLARDAVLGAILEHPSVIALQLETPDATLGDALMQYARNVDLDRIVEAAGPICEALVWRLLPRLQQLAWDSIGEIENAGVDIHCVHDASLPPEGEVAAVALGYHRFATGAVVVSNDTDVFITSILQLPASAVLFYYDVIHNRGKRAYNDATVYILHKGVAAIADREAAVLPLLLTGCDYVQYDTPRLTLKRCANILKGLPANKRRSPDDESQSDPYAFLVATPITIERFARAPRDYGDIRMHFRHAQWAMAYYAADHRDKVPDITEYGWTADGEVDADAPAN